MRIGILTFHNAHNYGAMLQCFALQQYLLHCGYIVEVIDYRPACYRKQYEPHTFSQCLRRNLFRVFKSIFYDYILYNKRCAAFNQFLLKYIKTSKEINSIPNNYDAYIVGSDQIWNPAITNGFEDTYFCNFSFVKGERKYISYAPSMELKQLSKSEEIYLKKVLSQFDAISLREDSAIPLLQPLTSKHIFQVCDPVLLGGIDIWKDMIQKRLIKSRYVIVYQIRELPDVLVLAERVAQQINGEIIILTARVDKHYTSKYQTASPLQFVNYIYYSEFVITTSFHGCAFSILFNKQFYTFRLNDNFDLRSTALLKAVGLENRMLDTIDELNITAIDYREANSKLFNIRKSSMNYLNSALSY